MLEPSQWTYETAGAGGVSIGKLLVSGGKFILRNPEGRFHAFNYAGIGMNMGSIRLLPKNLGLPDLVLPRSKTQMGASGATTDFPGRGVVYRFHERELVPNDFTGISAYIEVGAGVLMAGAATGFITGLSRHALIPWLLNPGLFSHAILANLHALIVLGGASEGLLDTMGGGIMCGAISDEGPVEIAD
ncbi:hypothetical protein [Caballeronia sp. LZ035]|uniref:hypothetical protein n=1 Tax=Caballeronia sp. LZ035 TaxID=3038568 RepID=UPI002859D93A|nr:hypothetical protein [Caballeronia sp. LZ035]MDR5762536.1 hypothetical protein [Caballeronia sp. LZ035]